MMTTRDISYEADGLTMVGRLAVPAGATAGATPAVLIAHEANGLDEHQRSRAEELAALGFVAFALDYHGGGTPPPFADAQARTSVLLNDAERMRALATAGLDVLLAEPAVDPAKVAAIGYCFGGAMVLELGRAGADLRAIVGFHPGLRTASPDDASNIRGVVLVCIGSEDPIITPEDRLVFEREMRAGGVDWRLHLYGGVEHSFTPPHVDDAGIPGLRYDERSAALAWKAMLDLFDEVLLERA